MSDSAMEIAVGQVWRERAAQTSCNDVIIVGVYPDAISFHFASSYGPDGNVRPGARSRAESRDDFTTWKVPAAWHDVIPCPEMMGGRS